MRPPLLMVNGYAATGADWDPALLAALGRGFEPICPDNRGMGASPLRMGEGVSVESMARDLAAMLAERGVERIAVAGWSMGGFVAQQLAADRPDLVSKLVLLATDPGGPGSVAADPAVTARLIDHGGTPREQATRLLGLLFSEPVAERVDAEAGELVAAARAELSEPALFAQEAAMDAWHAAPAEPRLAAIRAPTLVLAGDMDVVIPPANAALLANSIAGARRRVYAGAGHAFMAQEAPAVAAEIAEFLG